MLALLLLLFLLLLFGGSPPVAAGGRGQRAPGHDHLPQPQGLLWVHRPPQGRTQGGALGLACVCSSITSKGNDANRNVCTIMLPAGLVHHFLSPCTTLTSMQNCGMLLRVLSLSLATPSLRQQGDGGGSGVPE